MSYESDGTAWWEGLTEEELALELAEERRQDELAEEVYRWSLTQPHVPGTDLF
jgi:hypothetical protein